MKHSTKAVHVCPMAHADGSRIETHHICNLTSTRHGIAILQDRSYMSTRTKYSTSSPHFRESPCRSFSLLYKLINCSIPLVFTWLAHFLVSSQDKGDPSDSSPILRHPSRWLVGELAPTCFNFKLVNVG